LIRLKRGGERRSFFERLGGKKISHLGCTTEGWPDGGSVENNLRNHSKLGKGRGRGLSF